VAESSPFLHFSQLFVSRMLVEEDAENPRRDNQNTNPRVSINNNTKHKTENCNWQQEDTK